MRIVPLLAVLPGALALAACGGETDAPPSPVNDVDPYLARALNDPLMVDPDLAHLNEANAAITIGYDHALPSFKGSVEAANRARGTARLELLETGPVVELPFAASEPGPASLANAFGVEAVLDTIDLPLECRKDIAGDFTYAAQMPEIARVMPHGMVRVAARVDQPECAMHLVRYVTPVAAEDALEYHFNLASREQLSPTFFKEPEMILSGDRRGTHLRVHARPTSGNLTAVDVITWSRP